MKLVLATRTGSTTFDITQSLSMAALVNPDKLQFGDERFFYGNIETYIGATIYKTLFDIRINADEFDTTTNPTMPTDNQPNIKVSEIGVYDSDKNLVLIGKLSKPIALASGNVITTELSIDF